MVRVGPVSLHIKTDAVFSSKLGLGGIPFVLLKEGTLFELLDKTVGLGDIGCLAGDLDASTVE